MKIGKSALVFPHSSLAEGGKAVRSQSEHTVLSIDREAYRITDLWLVHEEGGYNSRVALPVSIIPPCNFTQRSLPCLNPTNQHHHSGKPLPIADPFHVALELAKTRTQYPNKDTHPPLSCLQQPQAT